MEREEFARFAAAYKQIWPRAKEVMSDSEGMELWYTLLQDVSYQEAQRALLRMSTSSTFAPSIAEIRQEIGEERELAGGQIEDWSTGWQEVISAIARWGMYREYEALRSMSETTQEAVKRLGWKNICTSINQAADRANFRQIYEIIDKRRKKSEQITTAGRIATEDIRRLTTDGNI